MRTTLTLDADVAASLRAEMRKTGRSFKQTVNETIRRGFAAPREKVKPFKVKPFNMGVFPNLDYDNIGRLLEQLDGPLHK